MADLKNKFNRRQIAPVTHLNDLVFQLNNKSFRSNFRSILLHPFSVDYLGPIQ